MKKIKNKTKQLLRRQRQEELLKLFEGDFYQEKQFNGGWYVKQFNGNTERWQVAIYSEESFQKYKFWGEKKLAKQKFEQL